MELTTLTMTDLFDQLGLPSGPREVTAFIARYRPLPSDLKLTDAPFWSDSQAVFLAEGLRHDSDWALVIDTLNARLRIHPQPDDLPRATHEGP